MIRHLLLVGHDLEPLIHLSVGLASSFSTITLATTSDVDLRAAEALHERFDAVVVRLDAQDALPRVQEVMKAPKVMFLVEDSPIGDALHAAGAQVIDANDAPILITASILALGSTPSAEVR